MIQFQELFPIFSKTSRKKTGINFFYGLHVGNLNSNDITRFPYIRLKCSNCTHANAISKYVVYGTSCGDQGKLDELHQSVCISMHQMKWRKMLRLLLFCVNCIKGCTFMHLSKVFSPCPGIHRLSYDFIAVEITFGNGM